MTSSFERHGIDHLSASSANLFAAQPALWIAEKLLKRSSPVGAAAHRGSAVEAGVAKALLNPNLMVQECIEEAERVFRMKTALSTDARRETIGKKVADITRNALMEVCAYGPGAVCQQRIEWKSPEISVPFIGFVDFYWPEQGILIDLKTTDALPSKIKISHARQIALYAGSLGDNVDARLTYATPTKMDPTKPNSATYQLEDARGHLDCLVVIGRTIERFLAVSNDPMELAGLLVPDTDSFYFTDHQARQTAWDIWHV